MRLLDGWAKSEKLRDDAGEPSMCSIGVPKLRDWSLAATRDLLWFHHMVMVGVVRVVAYDAVSSQTAG